MSVSSLSLSLPLRCSRAAWISPAPPTPDASGSVSSAGPRPRSCAYHACVAPEPPPPPPLPPFLEQHRAQASLHCIAHFPHRALLLPPLHCSRVPPPHGCHLQVRAHHSRIPRPPSELPSMMRALCLTSRAPPAIGHRW
jgi:hypothetical protein